MNTKTTVLGLAMLTILNYMANAQQKGNEVKLLGK